MFEALVGAASLALVLVISAPLTRTRRPAPAGSTRLGLVLVLLAVVMGGVMVRSPLVALIAPVSATMLSRRAGRRRLLARSRRREEEVPRVLDAAIQRLGSGSSLGSALAEALAENPLLAVVPEVADALEGLRAGEAIEDELAKVAARLETGWAALLASTVDVMAATGGPRVPALERLADTLRDQQHARREAEAQSAQARASAVVMGGLPLGFALVVAAVSPDARTLYLYSWAGAACVAASLGLTAACWLVFDRVLGSKR